MEVFMEQAVLFDCDGVLVDSEEGLSKIASFVLNRHYDIPAVPEDFAQYIGTGEDSYIGGVVRKYDREYIFEMKKSIYDEYDSLAVQYVPPMDGAREIILKLRSEGFKVALVSSADLKKVNINLKILGLDHSDFDAVLSGNDVENKKPEPDIYLTAADRCKAKPGNCIVVEDATSGVISGKRAGMKVIGFTSSVEEIVLKSFGADHTVKTMAELYEVIHAIH
jgi:HAD superfamily hydrolase (TIGR01509 family)